MHNIYPWLTSITCCRNWERLSGGMPTPGMRLGRIPSTNTSSTSEAMFFCWEMLNASASSLGPVQEEFCIIILEDDEQERSPDYTSPTPIQFI